MSRRIMPLYEVERCIIEAVFHEPNEVNLIPQTSKIK